MTDGCPTCGRNFRKWEFRFDAIGRTILEHRCDPADIAAYQERQAESVAAPTLPPKFCRRCERKFLPQSIVQLRCRLCIPIYNRERDRRLRAAARLRDVA